MSCKKFHKLQDAIDDIKKNGTGTERIFSKEVNRNSRIFLVCTKEQFYSFYKELPENLKHYYEIITEDFNVKLYFDLEFLRAGNEEKNGPIMVQRLIEIINEVVKGKFNIDSSHADVLILDSSTPNKFSNHLIFQNVIFSDFKACKDFVKCVTESFLEIDFELFTVIDSHRKFKLMIDSLVYNRNQNFRLLHSYKLGRKYPFKLDKNNTFMCSNPLDDRLLFLKSLVCDNLTVNTESTGTNVPVSNNIPVSNSIDCSILKNDKSVVCSSKFPEIEKFVKSLIGKSGQIRKVSMYENASTSKPMIILDIDYYRYCANIGREHRSNHIFYVYDVVNQVIFQKCRDPGTVHFWPISK